MKSFSKEQKTINEAYADVVDCFAKEEYKKLSLSKLENMSYKAQRLTMDVNIKKFTPSQRVELINANRVIYGHLLARQEKRAKGFLGIIRGLFDR